MRPDILNPLFAEVTALKGVGTVVEKALGKLGITRVIDLLFHLPSGWTRRRRIARLDDAVAGEVVAITVTPVEYRQGGRGPLRVNCVDAQGDILSIIYFGRQAGGYAKKLLPLQVPVTISGKLDLYGQERQIAHPEVLAPGESFALAEPVYPLSEGITSRQMAKLIEQALERVPALPEWIEPGLLDRRGWAGFNATLAAVHSQLDNDAARLAYDEVFANQLALMLVRASARKRRGTPLIGDGRLRAQLRLPYEPTGAQRRTMREIEGDMAQGTPMVRLLQGDVGAGKTLVALEALLIAVEGGAQGAMLAPTEILARQHFANLSALLAGVDVRIAILTGRDKGRVREATLIGLASGEIDILVGTHAIFQEHVTYRRLGLAVVDEQHRFGVAQRMLLTDKAERPPHLLAMTATPIPRTLTLTQYGEMDVSRLDEMPPGRTPVRTTIFPASGVATVIDRLGDHVTAGGQAFWVCPLVEESEASDLASAEARAELLRQKFGAVVGLVHGRMKGPEKDAVMSAFAAGDLSVLVATTVIEVGVDVPNASLMIVEEAERFGLAQLHQLRGRVGRGAKESTCVLLRGDMISEVGRQRLALMRETNDGFVIAEKDLEWRGGGAVLGTQQAGKGVGYKLATPEQLSEFAPIATDDARLLTERDGGLDAERGQAARIALYLFERDAAVGMLRSG
jgi:ATP-dependent DNA helicase RecG